MLVMKRCLVMACVAVTVCSGLAMATPIALVNAGFEDQPAYLADGSGTNGAIPGWSVVRTEPGDPNFVASVGVQNPSSAQIASQAHGGEYTAFANDWTWSGSSMRQVTGATFAANTTYTLSLFTAHRNDIPLNWGDNTAGHAQLLLVDADTNSTVASTTYDLSSVGQWYEVTLTLVTPASADYLGHALAVQFETLTDSVQLLYDDVSLSAVPEPMTLGLLAVGAIGLIRRK
jgi:hypothetical protein